MNKVLEFKEPECKIINLSTECVISTSDVLGAFAAGNGFTNDVASVYAEEFGMSLMDFD